jgi:hypothetical protein
LVGWALPTSFKNGVHYTLYTKLSTIPKAYGLEAATHQFASAQLGCSLILIVFYRDRDGSSLAS